MAASQRLADDDIDARHACLCKFADQFTHRSAEVRLGFKIRRETIDVHQRKYRDRKPAAKRNEMAQLVAACGTESGGSVDAVVSNHRDGSAVETNKAGDGSFAEERFCFIKQTIICNRAGNFPYEAFCAFIKKTRAVQIRTFINLDNAFCLAGRQNFNQAAHFRSNLVHAADQIDRFADDMLAFGTALI